jgi:hypothetical protein
MSADSLVSTALSYQNFSYGDPDKRRAYLLHQYNGDVDDTGEPTAAAKEFGKTQYGCLLHARGVLAENQVDGTIPFRGKLVDVLRCSYRVPYLGLVETMLQELARARGLLVMHTDQESIADVQPADLLVIGEGGQAPADPAQRQVWLANAGGVAHGVFVTGVDGQTIESVDGGGIDPLNSCHGSLIRRCVRTVGVRNGKLWLNDRRISWRLRCADLPVIQK